MQKQTDDKDSQGPFDDVHPNGPIQFEIRLSQRKVHCRTDNE